MWTSRHAILRDLSLAQGGRPPATGARAADHTLRAADRPTRRALDVDIQLSEEYVRLCHGESELPTDAGPDLQLIQHMLHMVRELDINQEENTDDIAIISKLNPFSEEFTPKCQMNKSHEDATPQLDPRGWGDMGQTKSDKGPNSIFSPDKSISRKINDLQMRELDINQEENPDDIAIISKLNTFSEKVAPKSQTKENLKDETPQPPDNVERAASAARRPRRSRNVALQSILQALQDEKATCRAASESAPPLPEAAPLGNGRSESPNDKKGSSENGENRTNDSKRKPDYKNRVNDWIDSATAPPHAPALATTARRAGLRRALAIDPAGMFRRKAEGSSPSPCHSHSPSPAPVPAPAAYLEEYSPAGTELHYARYVNNQRLRDEAAALQETIWARVEAEMKNIERKRPQAARALQTAPSPPVATSPSPPVATSPSPPVATSPSPPVATSPSPPAPATPLSTRPSPPARAPTPHCWESLLSESD